MKKLVFELLAVVCFALICAAPGHSAAIRDSESASHGDSASSYEVVQTYDGKGFRIVQFNLAVLSHYSYILSSDGEALVVDPGRDIQAYLTFAASEGLSIKGVFLTHSHADFVAGHTEFSKLPGCRIYVNRKTGAGYAHEPLTEQSALRVGSAVVKFLETPGHTPDGMCGLVCDGERLFPAGKSFVSGESEASALSVLKPRMMFSGDTLFVGSLGRPDLMGTTTTAESLARMMFSTWNDKLAKLPDDLLVLPAHGAGSLCGAHLSDNPSSTIGAEKASNPYLKHAGNVSAFIATVLDNLPDAPQYFKHNAAMNHDGPPPVDWNAAPGPGLPPDVSLADATKTWVLDLRPAAEFASGHIPNSVNIAVRGRLETWTGIMVPWGSNLVLCGNDSETREALHRLHRVGYTAKSLTWDSWNRAGLPVSRNGMVKPADLYSQMQSGTSPLVVDVRLPAEWMALRIGTVLNIPLNRLTEIAPAKLEKSEPIVAVCNSAFRSSMAVGLLERVGFTKAMSLDGGSEAWIQAGFPTISPEGASPHTAPGTGAAAPSTPTDESEANLPDRISPPELHRMILDLPGSFELVDIRPPEMFADYALPESKSVPIDRLIGDRIFTEGRTPLVIVDRDGSLAMIAAGILSRKTSRRVKALHGGLEAFWRQIDAPGRFPIPGGPGAAPAGSIPPSLGNSSQEAPRRPSTPGVPLLLPKPAPSAPPSGNPQGAPTPAPAAPKKKSSGC